MDQRAEIRAFLTSRRAKVTPEEAGLTLLVYTAAEADSSSDERLRLLASWAATLERAELTTPQSESRADRP